MIFSTSTTHALRTLAHLAARSGDDAVLGRDLAREVGIPAPYLAKVLATLARAGVVTASRGARGGYRLARPPREIALIEIVEPLEGKRVRPGCLLRPGEPCHEDAACTAHAAWSAAKLAYTRFLESTTRADIQGGAARAGARGGTDGGRRSPARRAGRARG
ncbi:MAG TPA: Rrf2 family transcriptional regulator [Anaeromyxobacteraceae bacterium]|nr:Rrf2 family transcriptional regulator [Anaeromyxobacteraceae bacterium]